MNNAQNNSTMTTIDLTSAKRLTFKAMTTATAGLGQWELRSGNQWKHGVYFPETDTLVKVSPWKEAALIDFCRGSLERVEYKINSVWEWGA